MMKLNLDLLKDIEKNKDDKLNIEKSVKNFNKPLLMGIRMLLSHLVKQKSYTIGQIKN